MSRDDKIALGLVLGTASSLIATVIASLASQSWVAVGVVSAAAGTTALTYALVFRRRFNILRSMGITDWESSMVDGTTTRDCIVESQTSLRFLGIAASKWLAEPELLRQMLQRHASNGGHAEFLLLDPDSDQCRRFEVIKNRPPGSLAAHIRNNAVALIKLQSDHYRISVRFYNVEPRFRVVILDSRRALLGLYAFTSEGGDDTPQLVFDSAPRPWSFFYGINAYFLDLWERSRPLHLILPSSRTEAISGSTLSACVGIGSATLSGSFGQPNITTMKSDSLSLILSSQPSDIPDRLLSAYSTWCRTHPPSFGTADDRLLPAPVMPRDIIELAEIVKSTILSNNPPNILSSLVSDQGLTLLWCLHEAHSGPGKRLLYDIIPILAPLESVRRGGANVYKRFSWTMHVLAVSQFLWRDVPYANLPPSLSSSATTLQAMKQLRSEYGRLTAHEVTLLRIATVIHDIGVQDGVSAHDKKGIPYVRAALNHLGGPDSVSRILGGTLSSDESILALEALVGEHTLASKVNGEEGLSRIKQKLECWLSRSAGKPQLLRFFEHSFPRLLGVFLVCDIFGVADELVTAASIRRACHSISILTALVGNNPVSSMSDDDRLDRIGHLIGVDNPRDVYHAATTVFDDSSAATQVVEMIGDAELLDYSMAVLKPLHNPMAAIAILAFLGERWKRELKALGFTHQPLVVNFSPHCDLTAIGKWGLALVLGKGNAIWNSVDDPSKYGIRLVLTSIGTVDMALNISTETSVA